MRPPAIALTLTLALASVLSARGASAARPPVPASFVTHDGGWLTVEYPPSARDRIAPVVAIAGEVRAELAELLRAAPLEAVDVRVARGADEMVALAPDSPPPHAGPTSMSYADSGLIVLSLGSATGEPNDLVEAFRGELARIALYRAVGVHPVPHWLDEGLAARFAHPGGALPDRLLWTSAIRGRLLPVQGLDTHLDALDAQAPLALAQATDWVRFLTMPPRALAFAGAVERLSVGEPVDAAFGGPYGTSLTSLDATWHRELTHRAWWLLSGAVALVAGLFAAAWLGLRARRHKRDRLDQARAERTALSGRRGRAARAKETDAERVHIVFGRRDGRRDATAVPEHEVPKIEHDGEWHTLH